MSRLATPNQPRVVRYPEEQVKYFADLYRDSINPTLLANLQARVENLELRFTNSELLVLGALDTPDKVQIFLDTQLYYNDDHISVEQDETAFSPRRVLQTGMAHCFEGALFAYTVNYLHGHHPCFMLLETTQDIEHNLVVWQDPRTQLYGCNAHSTYPGLDGRPAQYPSLRALAESYYPYYYSIRSNDLTDIVLVGYSDPFDLVARFGTAWMASDDLLWDIYYTYIDESVQFHYLRDESGEPHLYPLVRALKEGWIQIDSHGQGFVSTQYLPAEAHELWHKFWQLHSDAAKRPKDNAVEIEKRFFELTGTTPIDLFDHADDLQWFLAAGYHVQDLFIREP